jgi:hypothetical protein
VVDAVAGVGDTPEGPLVVLGLEAEVALAHDDDRGESEVWEGADALNVSLHQSELLARLCRDIQIGLVYCVEFPCSIK